MCLRSDMISSLLSLLLLLFNGHRALRFTAVRRLLWRSSDRLSESREQGNKTNFWTYERSAIRSNGPTGEYTKCIKKSYLELAGHPLVRWTDPAESIFLYTEIDTSNFVPLKYFGSNVCSTIKIDSNKCLSDAMQAFFVRPLVWHQWHAFGFYYGEFEFHLSCKLLKTRTHNSPRFQYKMCIFLLAHWVHEYITALV